MAFGEGGLGSVGVGGPKKVRSLGEMEWRPVVREEGAVGLEDARERSLVMKGIFGWFCCGVCCV